MKLLLTLVSGLLLVLGFPKWDFSFLLFICFIPFYFVLESSRLKETILYGLFFGFIVHLLGFYWLTFTMKEFGGFSSSLAFLTLILFALASGVSFALFGGLLRTLSLHTPIPFLLTAPLSYTVIEYIFPHLFPWYLPGGFYRELYFIQIADITGVYGLTFFIVFINTVFFQIFKSLLKKQAFPWIATSIAILISFLLFFYGWNRIHFVKGKNLNSMPLQLSLLQTNVGNFEKSIEGQSQLSVIEQVHERNFSMILEAAKNNPDLIVLPETSVPGDFNIDLQLQLKMFDRAAVAKTPLYFGGYAKEFSFDKTEYFNSTFLISPERTVLGRYNKVYLLMFGEYMPLSNIFPSLKKLIKEVSDFSSGKKVQVFPLQGERMGALICYEDLISSFVRAVVKGGATFLLNVVNNSWFGESACAYQHLALSVFRSIEHKVPLVRCTNTGISAFIDATGFIQTQSKLGEKIILSSSIQSPRITTFYTKFGDVFALMCCLILAFILIGICWQKFCRKIF